MNGLTGIEMVQNIPLRYRPRFLIFTTSSREHAIDAFALNATHYLVKPLTREDVFCALDRCMKQQSDSPVLALHNAAGLITIPLSSIVYLESFNKRTLVHTATEIISTYDTLSSLMEQLDSRFLRPQRSYIVSMAHISSFHYDHLILDNELEITLSRKNRKELKQQYQDYLFQAARENF